MNSDINLVSKNKINPGKRKIIKRLRYVAAFSLAFVLVIAILLFIVNALNSPTQVKKDKDAVLAKISGMNKKAVNYNLASERLLSISEIINSRTKHNDLIRLMLKDKPEDVTTQALLVDSNSVSLTLNSSSLLTINNYMKTLIKLSSENKSFTNLTIESLSTNSRTGQYTLSLKVFTNGLKN